MKGRKARRRIERNTETAREIGLLPPKPVKPRRYKRSVTVRSGGCSA